MPDTTTDRELLELAAKAAGRVYVDGESWDDGAGWNPLEDDGDAFRLAVKLYLWEPFRLAHREVSDTVDIYAATRRCITRAAAEVQREREAG